MMFETHYGGLVNLNRAVQVFIEDNAPTEVIAVFSAQTISFFAPRGKARAYPSPYPVERISVSRLNRLPYRRSHHNTAP